MVISLESPEESVAEGRSSLIVDALRQHPFHAGRACLGSIATEEEPAAEKFRVSAEKFLNGRLAGAPKAWPRKRLLMKLARQHRRRVAGVSGVPPFRPLSADLLKWKKRFEADAAIGPLRLPPVHDGC